MIYKIPVSWEVCGEVEIEADSLEEAIDKAWDDEIPLPTESHYIDASWQVDGDLARILDVMNKKEDG